MYAHIYSEDLLRAQNLLAETKVLLESVSKEPRISVKLTWQNPPTFLHETKFFLAWCKGISKKNKTIGNAHNAPYFCK